MSYNPKIGVVGLGYVGLPVAVHLAQHFDLIGFDVSKERVAQLKDAVDKTNEVDKSELLNTSAIFTAEKAKLSEANFFIVAVPTPIDGAKIPDLSPLRASSQTVGSVLKSGDIVVFESTVYPGATEEVCIPILEKESGLKAGKDFKVGYSPERINPGDKERTFTTIKKVISAQDEDSLEKVSKVYSAAVKAGVFKASSIKVAEAAKVIENTQRDVNIALMNELSQIFDKMNISTLEVLEAAGTKWNFLKFVPGLVGGHCIGVDPYYLTYKAKSLNYHPEVILSGRRINDSMAKFIVEKLIKEMISAGVSFQGATVNIYGLTFKENCPDVRNSKVFQIIDELADYGIEVNVSDPHVLSEDLPENLRAKSFEVATPPKALASILAVSHDEFKSMELQDFKTPIVFDVKGVFQSKEYKGVKRISL